MQQIGILILGAGSSSRMGEPKQLLEWRGKALVNHALDQAIQANAGPVVLVLGAKADLIQSKLRAGAYTVAVNEAWSTGMGSSIACGLRALLAEHGPLAGVLITLVDQPLVASTHLKKIIQKFKKKSAPITVASYGDTLGVPALFSADLFPELLTLSGQKGAKAMISKYSKTLTKLPLPAALIDLDTPEEWHAFLTEKNFGNY